MQAPSTDVQYVARVQVFRWIISGLFLIAFAALFMFLFFGALNGSIEFGEGANRRGNLFITLLPIWPFFAAFFFLYGLYCLYFGIRAEHVTIDPQGVRTKSWQLAWPEILEVEMRNKKKLFLWVTPEAAQRVRPANRWHSGHPGGLGGMLAKKDTVGLQALLSRQNEVFDLISAQLAKRTEHLQLPPN
ncbi:MAG: hypothetical protein Q4C81_09250 [Kocuria sp.]|nr:hypothetical protein [Kocuria sp.]